MTTIDQLVRWLNEHGLCCDEVTDPHSAVTPGELVERLLQEQQLTEYQADVLRAGDPDQLVLGEYLLLDPIGRGGMGQVYRARHRRMKRIVALKLLPPEATANEEAVKRFHREVEAAARLVHPGVVTAYDAGEARGQHFLVMEYVVGRDLAGYLAGHGPLPLRSAVEFTLQAARALDYAHAQGVIHRDVKPSNLLVDDQGTVKLLDLGLARFDGSISTADPGSEDLTHTRQVMGTADYMSPEQAVNTKHADQRSDIYSLGCTLYRLLVGRGPYGGETVVEKILAHREQPVPSLLESRNSVPTELEQVYLRMMAKRPEDRYQSMREVAQALEGVLPTLAADDSATEIVSHGFSGTMLPPDLEATRPAAAVGQEETEVHSASQSDLTQQRSSPPTRRRAMLLAGVALLLVGVPFAAWFWWDYIGPGSSANGNVDLLSRIDPARDARDGRWQFQDGALIGGTEDLRPLKLLRTGELRAQLQVPYRLPGEYDLQVEVERLSGPGPLAFGLTTPSSQFLVVLGREFSGLEQLDRKLRPANELAPGDDALEVGHVAEIVCRVRVDGIEVLVDGKPAVVWRGRTDQLELPPGWLIADGGGMPFVGCIRSRFKFSKLKLAQPQEMPPDW